MNDWREEEKRILAIVGGEDVEFKEAIQAWHRHLVSNLSLSCDVTGIEDFRWEEFYVLGPGSAEEYRLLRKSRPSYEDAFELDAIDIHSHSEWLGMSRGR